MAGPGGLGIAEEAVTKYGEGNEVGSLSSLFKSIIGILGVDEPTRILGYLERES